VIRLALPLGSILLVNSMDSGCRPLLYAACNNVALTAAIRDTGGGGHFDATVESVVVEDHHTKSSKFRKVIRPIDTDGGERKENWFSIHFFIRPLEDVADYKLILKVNPVVVVPLGSIV